MDADPFRAGSYGLNTWLILTSWFTTEGEIVKPSFTPVVGDAVNWLVQPLASDLPPKNLFSPVYDPARVGGPADWWAKGQMLEFVIPRHGGRPNPVPTNWPENQPLPGAVNVSFFDGHGELVKLDRLWQLYWHKDYQPPAKRPGLR